MDLSQDDVIGILKLIDESPMGRVTLELGELKLEVIKGTGALAPPAALPQQPAIPQIAEATVITTSTVSSTAPSGAVDIAGDPSLVAIEAPLLGIFYRRPEPGAPPYVEVGSLVNEETTVALIEVMKLFKPVTAGVRGRVEKICVENGELVNYLQPLFLVRIDG